MQKQARAMALTGMMVLTVATLAASHVSAQARTFRVISGSRIQFVSDAPLERTTGVSQSVNGQFTLDAAHPTQLRGRVSVPINTIRTGMDLRDQHLRGDGWLDAARFPDATFEVVSVSGLSVVRPNETVRAQIRGRFTVHGRTQDITAEAQLRLVPLSAETRAQGATADIMRVQARFTVNLTNHGVSVPAPVRLKINNEIQVNVTLRAQAS